MYGVVSMITSESERREQLQSHLSDEMLDELLQSLYVINKHAKQYAEQGTENYRKGKKASAKRNSVRKDALYTLKSLILDDIKDDAKEITIHRIESNIFYCFTFKEYSFHSPYNQHEIQVETDIESLDDFDSSSEKEITRSLKESLQYITEHTEYNPNEYLTQQYIDYPSGSYFTGWSYIGDE